MKQFYTVAEISEIFALPKSTVYDLVKTGRIDYLKPTRLGGAIRFHKPTVDRHIKQLEAA